MARLRLGYTKSRTGCLRCKQRRVKCDENRPSCKACIRHGIECSLSTEPSPDSPASSSAAAATPSPRSSPAPQPAPSRSSRARPRPINPKPTLQPPPSAPHAEEHMVETRPSPNGSALAFTDSPSTATPDPFPYLTKFVTGPPEEDTADWVFDLELLHHFTTSTYQTFRVEPTGTLRPGTHRLWQIEVPRLAFVHVFLLHQILAIASYHLAHLHSQSRQAYSLRASQHQNAGIRRMRTALSELSAANCHAVFASSSLLFIGSLAASCTTSIANGPGPTVDDLIDVMILVKGIGSVLYSSRDLLQSGPLAELFVDQVGSGHGNPALDRVVLAVGDFLVEIAETESDDRVRAVIHADAYRLVTAIREALVRASEPEYRVVAAWPIMMSDDLIPLLRQRNQAALALLSYFCVVFHAAELQGYWFLQGWAPGVIRDLSMTMAGPWKRHSAWALGWITGHAAMG
ncbi:hypothetical protein C8A00DRAFT_43351 [Chaetomidium leptoderma]|uniref:Zn(2)-C6 fungal-type domain-containing protein n=1 Tax=Chaetomidium leptoderma TaxID=669021 RepID=A0AAN6VMC2_9PEZI|nr:hypothetical protein C8A00DRAFT_43351 [Chaetomidium leptoderma]